MFKSLSIKSKLGILVAIPVIASIFITATGAYYVNKISEDLIQSTYDEGFQSIALVLNADRDAYQALDNMDSILLGYSKGTLDPATTEADLKSYDENIEQATDRVKQAMDILTKDKATWGKYKDEANGKTVFEHYDGFMEDYTRWLDIAEQIQTTYSPGEDYISVFDSAREHLNAIGELIEAGVKDSIAVNEERKNTMIITMAVINVIVTAVIVVLAALFIRSVTGPLRKSVTMFQEMMKGRLSGRLNLDQRDEIGILGESMDRFAENLQNNVIGTMKRISEGDLDLEIKVIDQQDEIGPVMKTTVENLKALVSEAEMLTVATVEGDLDARGNAEAFRGGYREIVAGINATLDALTGPLKISADYMDRISKGDIPPVITEEYKGDFDGIKNSINTCIEAINALVEDINDLTAAAIEGRLSERADAGRHNGDFGRAVEGMNATLDAVIAPLLVTAEYLQKIGKGEIPKKITDSYNGDFEMIKNDINACIDGLGGLAEGRDILVRMAQNDYSGVVKGTYLGIYSQIAESVNTVSGEIRHVIDTLSRVAQGNLDDLAELKSIGSTDGQNRLLVPQMVAMIESIKNLVDEAGGLSEAAVEGDLSVRGDVSKFKGEYRNVIEGVNATLNAMVVPIKEAGYVLQEMAAGNLQSAMNGTYKGHYAEIQKALNETISNMRNCISEISGVLAGIAGGNLNIEITADYKGDFVEIKDSLSNIMLSLSQVIGDIREAAEQVNAGSMEVSGGSQALAQGSTEQAGSIQQLTASIAEIAAQTRQNAVNANEANELAGEARSNAEKGNTQMKEMLDSMADISKSSVNISRIIKVIDDIAFQTNILALNAAVEAARAGQHGKGFAVVAEEVRSLAARSAEAARETTELIEGSIRKVQEGTRIAGDTAAALGEIVSGVEKAANLVGGIAEASNEQASGIAQINKGIEQLSRVVQNNSATAEESAAASEELFSQSEVLKGLVDKFVYSCRTVEFSLTQS